MSQVPADPAGDVKRESTIARDSRMTLRKNNEEVLRKALQAEARKQCVAETQAFGDCAKASGLSVIFSCRKQNIVSGAVFLAPRHTPPPPRPQDNDD